MTTDRSQGERLPAGFTATVANIGIKDSTDDIVVIAAEGGCASAGVFTRSRFAGPSVTVSRENLRGGRSDAMVVISKNANVANGSDGLADAREVLDLTGALIGASPTGSCSHRPGSSAGAIRWSGCAPVSPASNPRARPPASRSALAPS